MLKAKTVPDGQEGSQKIVRLWIHEVYRVFYDRLVDENDRNLFFQMVKVSILHPELQISWDNWDKFGIILPLTTYVIRILCFRKIKALYMVECLKSYCRSCSFQSLQNAYRCTKTVRNNNFTTIVSFQFFLDPTNTSSKHISLILRCIWSKCL